MTPLALITGGAGFIGSHLADKLLASGYRVRVLDNLLPQVHGSARRRPSYLAEGVELCVGDVRDAHAVDRALSGADAVFHLAALVGVGLSSQSIVLTTLLLIVCFAALGAGNGALFQLVPLRWPTSTAVAGSMIGEIGALGGGLVPMLMGQSKQNTDSFLTGFIVLAVFSLLMLGVMRKMQVRWTRTWAEKGGRARTA